MTRPVDEAKLGRWMRERTATSGALSLERLSAGRSNLTYLVDVGADRYVLRRPPEGARAERANDVLREARILQAVRERGVDVPEVIGDESDESIAGAPFFVMQFRRGRTVDTVEAASQFSAEQAGRLCDEVVDILVGIHSVDVLDGRLDWLGKPAGYIRRRVTRWREQWHRNAHRDLPLIDEIATLLAEHEPPEQQAALVHGDYRLGNLLVDPASAQVTAVLDWELCTRGDPLTDLAHLCIYWQPMPSRSWHPSQDVAALPTFRSAEYLMQRYSAASGRSLDRFDFYLVLGHWRSAIIKEAIYQRHVAGHADGAEFAQFGAAVIDHLLEARDIARGSIQFR